MVFLVITRAGFDAVEPRVDAAHDAVWINAGVLLEAEVGKLRSTGWNLTTFSNPLHPNDISADIATIREHHRGQVIWAEAVPYPGNCIYSRAFA